MSSDTEKKLPASTLFHRALLALIPAASLTIAAYHSGFAWYFMVPAVLFWGVGIWYLKRGSDRWNEQQR
ncbi:MAG TPA: hypothetical protein VEK81_06030 [Burkholderiales bacterium]|nr:hypothetical protein [Burkholderiales bacterium]